MHNDIESLLNNAGIRPTAVRILIVKELIEARYPLSSLELETLLETVDRSSITRTLTLLLDKGLLHSIDDGSGAAKFELCNDRVCRSHADHNIRPHEEMEESLHSDLHAHFHCAACGKTVCLPDNCLEIPPLPEGYVATTANFVITGLCPDCSRK